MRTMLAAALISLVLPGLALAQAAGERQRIAVTVVTLDQLRQGQEEYGRWQIDVLGSERFGDFEWVEPLVPASAFHCADKRPETGLDHCIRFYLRDGGGATAEVPAVVIVLDDMPGQVNDDGWGRMRAICFGAGQTASDAAAQTIPLWPPAQRMHGTRDLDADRAALTACVRAAAAEAR